MPAEETAESKPTSIAPGKKRSPWLMIISVIVVLILIGSAAVVLMRNKASLSVTITPSSLTLDAGKSRVFAVYPMDGSTNLTNNQNVKYSWSVTSTLGSLNLVAQQKTNFTAAPAAGNGTIKCTVTYKGLTKDMSASVTVKPPYLQQVSVSPPVKTLNHLQSQNFNATAISSVGKVLTGVTFTWNVNGLPSVNYTIIMNATNATFTSGTKNVANATLNATATYSGVTMTGTALITINQIVHVRSVNYLWYDMFNVPFQSYWNWRTPEEIPITHSYPYIYTYEVISNDLYYYSDLRLNMTAKNLTSVSTITNPLFFPEGLLNNFHPVTKGGTMTIDWYMNYPTTDECNTTQWGANLDSNFDGWIVELKGTVTLDRDAALSVLGGGANGLTSTILDNSFASWWSEVKSQALIDWHSWLGTQGGPGAPYDTWAMSGVSYDPLAASIDAAKVGNNIVLTIDDFSWGMDGLMAHWLHHAFDPMEWDMYDFNMSAVIGPEFSNIQVDGACMYVMYAYGTANGNEPCWVFEPCLGDSSYSINEGVAGEHSEMDPYNGLYYVNMAPGSGFYNKSMPWDYVPAACNLSANDTMKFEWPGGDLTFYKETTSGGVTTVQGSMIVNYGEPIDKDMPTLIKTDNRNRTLTYTGPIDMWDWSKTQTADQDLVDLWTSTGDKLLPQGAPFIEFKISTVQPSVAKYMTLSDVTNPLVKNTPTNIRATVWDQYGQVFTGYTGTVNFTANGTGATLPANYTFTLADAGTHVFSGLSFTGPGPWNYTITVKDSANASVNGSIKVMVIPNAQMIGHFAVLGIKNMNGGDRSGVRVIAYDQYGMKFMSYTGTVTFSSNATTAHELPANYAFVLGDHGDHNFSNAVSFEERGVYGVTVADTLVPSASGTQIDIIISSPPSVAYTAYDFFKEPWHEWWYERKLYEWDIVLDNESGNHTLIYNKDSSGYDGLIYAPYRWNTTAYNMTTLNVNQPEFMPTFGPKNVQNASVNMTDHWNYLNWTWWNSTIYPQWHTNPDWYALVDLSGTNMNSTMKKELTDGYYIADIISSDMNREAALTWLNLSLTTMNPYTWWNTMTSTGFTVGENYLHNWTAWLMNEGNHRLDIYNGYDGAYYNYGTMLNLTVLPNGNIMLTILHFNGGMDVLMTRWLTEAQICQHQPYAEDFTMAVKYYADQRTDLTYDEVAEWNFHAVMANGTVGGAAWVWEPMKIDYEAVGGHPSDYYDYQYVPGYPDYNCGDPNAYNNGGVALPWGSPCPYENAPAYFNLTSYETLTLKMPNHEVVGYLGKEVSVTAMTNVTYNHDYSDYDAITVHGYMTLGHFITNPFATNASLTHPYGAGDNLSQMWDNTTKVLTIHGPQLFDQYHWQYMGTDMFGSPIYVLNYSCTAGPILHGAPWIEFNMMSGSHVINSTAMSVTSGGLTPSMPSTASADLLALASVVCGTMMVVAALAIGMRRFREV